eukprot:CAMPEP_0171520554 /NCGR_PEP_ID=MMETSP0959-20130129/6589_1 /TAXON_ID=87120 /ORGANISM="Aurantiochytrium limacinum, Strain ATCCMYA-1381" /LENGTH=34 /DNA_ID= /DNA_START= /DNA_END= /DNA_ORIENTATION=
MVRLRRSTRLRLVLIAIPIVLHERIDLREVPASQ